MPDPRSYPDTILTSNAHLGAYDDHLNQLVNNVEIEMQRKALKEKQVKDSLIPPEVDINNLFAPDTKEVISDGLGAYTAVGQGWWDKGVDWSDPRNHEANKQKLEEEAKIRAKQLYSRQDKELYKNVLDKMSNYNFDKNFSRQQTQERVATWLSKPNIEERRKYLSEVGSLFVENEYDPYQAEYETAKKYQKSTFASDPVIKGGVSTITTTKKLAPEQEAAFANEMLSDERYKDAKQKEFSGFSTEKQAEYAQQAIEKKMNSPLDAYVASRYYLLNPVEETKKSTNLPGGGSSSQNKGSVNPIVSTVAAIRALDPKFVYDVNIGGNTYKKSDLLDGFVITKEAFKQAIPKVIQDENGVDVQVKDPKTGLQQYNYELRDEMIEDVMYDPSKKQWYISTNKIKNLKDSGGGINIPSFGWAYPMSDEQFTELVQKITRFQGEYNEGTVWENLKKAGKLNEEDNLINFDAIQPVEQQSDQFQLGD